MPVAPAGSASLVTANAFWSQVLTDMGAPITTANIQALNAWSQREGGGGQWNPLNTTRPAPGSTFFNHLSSGTGVQNYPNAMVGPRPRRTASITGCIPASWEPSRAAAPTDPDERRRGPIGQQLRKWSGGGYNNVNGGSGGQLCEPHARWRLQGREPDGCIDQCSGPHSSGGCLTLGASITNASATPVVGGLPGGSQIAGFFGWITQGCVQKRLLFQGLGILAVVYGLKFLGHDEPLKIVTAPASMAKAAL